MVSKTVGRFVSFERFAKILEELPRDLKDATIAGVRKGLQKGQAIVAEEIMADDAIATKEMIESVSYAPTTNGGKLWMDAPHAVYIEEGTRPHMPPVAPLIEWARVKFGAGPKEARAIGWAVAIKIREEGIAPRRFFRRAMRRIIRDVIPWEIRREMRNLKARIRYRARRG